VFAASIIAVMMEAESMLDIDITIAKMKHNNTLGDDKMAVDIVKAAR
jgi:hypothetical protein